MLLLASCLLSHLALVGHMAEPKSQFGKGLHEGPDTQA